MSEDIGRSGYIEFQPDNFRIYGTDAQKQTQDMCQDQQTIDQNRISDLQRQLREMTELAVKRDHVAREYEKIIEDKKNQIYELQHQQEELRDQLEMAASTADDYANLVLGINRLTWSFITPAVKSALES